MDLWKIYFECISNFTYFNNQFICVAFISELFSPSITPPGHCLTHDRKNFISRITDYAIGNFAGHALSIRHSFDQPTIPCIDTMGVGSKRIFYSHWFRSCIDIKYDDWLPGGAVDCNGYLYDKYVFYWQTKPAEQKNYQSVIKIMFI